MTDKSLMRAQRSASIITSAPAPEGIDTRTPGPLRAGAVGARNTQSGFTDPDLIAIPKLRSSQQPRLLRRVPLALPRSLSQYLSPARTSACSLKERAFDAEAGLRGGRA
jgi:hypothetical protein